MSVLKHHYLLATCFAILVISYASRAIACNKVSVRDFGAVGNGVADDSKSIQAAVNTCKTVFFQKGEYLISRTIVVPNSCTIKGENAVIKTLVPITMMQVNKGLVDIKGLIFYGSNIAVHGVVASPSCSSLIAKGCTFHGFYGTEKEQANGIYCSSGVSRVCIQGCVFYDIDAPKNGKIGDVYGSCQGILMMRINEGLVEKCLFHDIKSVEDGDCVQVYSGMNDEGRWKRSAVLIKDCVFKNIWHRAIKLQASGCTVTDCIIDADASRMPSSAIDVFGDNCSVINTNVDLNYGVHALTVSGNDFKLKGCNLSVDVNCSHSKKLTKLHSDVIYCVGQRGVFIDNTVIGGYIGFYSPIVKTGLVIRNNTFKASLVRNIRLYDKMSSEVIIENNSFEGNVVPIDLSGGDKINIKNNRMAMPASYILVLGDSFSGNVTKNEIKKGEEVRVKLRGN